MSLLKEGKKIMIFLDSMHSHDHVLEELRAYASLTSIGSYCVVFDTLIEDRPQGFYDRPWDNFREIIQKQLFGNILKNVMIL